MGGNGSGQIGGRMAVEDCISLRAADLLRYGYLTPEGNSGAIDYKNALGHHLYRLSVAVRGALLTLQGRQHVALESTPLHFGGRRWWFLCPSCSRRCATLHKPPARSDFACRLCHGLTYRLCLDSAGACGFSAKALHQAARSRRPRWVRKRDRRPDYKPRGWWLDKLKREAGILL